MTQKFITDINKFIDKVKGKETEFLKQFSQDLAEKIVTRTPVKTGFARASWYPAINDNINPPKLDPQKKGGYIQADFSFRNAKIGDRLFILNNANYIKKLEFGSSQQAPQGMVRVTLNEADAIAEDVIKRMGQ
ncbi:MAG: HK97-gp10 family putative phage morphogenesis protein [Smithella sp.]